MKRPRPSGLGDRRNLISKLTFPRASNAGKILGSYFLSRATGRPSPSGWPISLSIEPTTDCNLRCPECPSGLRSFSRETGMLRLDFFKTIVDEIQAHLLFLNLYFQGEPYLNPEFLEMVAYASSKKIYTMTSTNAHYLDDRNARRTIESGLDRLIISIDGTTQDVYESYRRGGQLSKVLEGTRNIVKWKERLKSVTPYVVFQFLVVKSNQHQIEDVKKLGRDCRVDDVQLKTAQVYDFVNGNELIPSLPRYSRYKKNPDGTWSIKNRLLNHCWKMWHSCVITWDGWVVPCCFDKDARHKFGNLKEHGLRELWRNDSYRNFRRSVLKTRGEIDICTNCTEGTKAWK